MRGREPGFLNRPTVPARSRRKEHASTKKLRHKSCSKHCFISGALSQVFFRNLKSPLTRVRVQTRECIAWVNFPEEHQRSLHPRWTVSPFSSPSSSELSHKGLEGETESRYYLLPSWLKYLRKRSQRLRGSTSLPLTTWSVGITDEWRRRSFIMLIRITCGTGSECWRKSGAFSPHREGGRCDLSAQKTARFRFQVVLPIASFLCRLLPKKAVNSSHLL